MNAPVEAPRRVAAGHLKSFMTEALAACGLSDADAAAAAAAILDADLSGVDSHGVFRLPMYVDDLRTGRTNARAAIHVIERAPATALVDGDNGMGHLVVSFAARTAVDIARESGVGWVGIRRSNHAGAASTYAAMPLAHNMIGIYAAVSGTNFMAPTGGAEPLLGTNPIAIAIPAGDEAPVVLDIATSLVSNGVVAAHALAGKPLPEGWLIDRKDGAPVTDPKRAGESLFVPIGGYKGAGLSLIIGLLAGVLNGAAFGRDLRAASDGRRKEINTGQFVIALDVARFLPLDLFRAEVDRHIRDLRGSARLPGFDAVRLPGEGRRARRAERQAQGIPMSAALLRKLDDMARSLSVAPLSARAAAPTP